MFAQLKHIAWKSILVGMVVGLLGFTIALAAPGSLDTTFSGDGRQVTDIAGNFNDELLAIAVQADGKIVAVGDRADPTNPDITTHDIAIARYKTDGNLDPAFSGDGKLLTDFGGVDQASNVAIQSDGKIVISGQRCSGWPCDLAVARYNPGGSLDTTFSGDGKLTIAGAGGDNGAWWGGLAIQADGKIVLARYIQNTSGDADFVVYRLRPNGTMDSMFSGDGKISFGFGAGREDLAQSVAVFGGKIIVGGYSCTATYSNCNFAVARLNSGGALDTTFSGDGKQMTDLGGDDEAVSVAVQGDGKIVLAGTTYTADPSYFAVVRYTTSGALDTTFSGDGKQTIDFGGEAEGCEVIVQPNGKILVTGDGAAGADTRFALARLMPAGNLDTTFSGDGKLYVDFGGMDIGTAIARQSDGKYVLGGMRMDSYFRYDFALARVMP